MSSPFAILFTLFHIVGGIVTVVFLKHVKGALRNILLLRTFLRAWSEGQLATQGPFAVMPDPIYGSFIVFVIPGISWVLNWWPILLTSVVMFVALRIFIHEEDKTMRKKFGRQYEEYRQKVLIKFL
jgi:protein-S-isoprenylcysteine O-methyltransferase Ste14